MEKSNARAAGTAEAERTSTFGWAVFGFLIPVVAVLVVHLRSPKVPAAVLARARAALAPYLRAELVVRVRSSEFVPQFEGEGHGNQLGVAVPHQLRAGRVACAPEPPAEARNQTDGVAEARRRRQLA